LPGSGPPRRKGVEINGLALYSGYGGIELGLKLAVAGYRTVCYVEREAPVAARVVELMEQKVMDEAPVWSDARTFDGKAWRGKVDVITAGFPCQPFSVAGKRKGHEDNRFEWPNVLRITNEVRPTFLFLENVPGILPYYPQIKEGLGNCDYVTSEPLLLSAADCFAPHRRDRIWILAYTESKRTESTQQPRQRNSFESGSQGISNPVSEGQLQQEGSIENIRGRSGNRSEELADTSSQGLQKRETGTQQKSILSTQYRSMERGTEAVQNPFQSRLEGAECEVLARTEDGRSYANFTGSDWWTVEPDVGRVAHGVADRVDRIRMLGNGVVPIVAAVAFSLLYERISTLAGSGPPEKGVMYRHE
jgi:DNA (cytosine-5)-methyltransferase 1